MYNSGMVVVSFDRATAAKFEDALASQEASKEYLCVVCVNLDAAGYPRDNPLEDFAQMRRKCTYTMHVTANVR